MTKLLSGCGSVLQRLNHSATATRMLIGAIRVAVALRHDHFAVRRANGSPKLTTEPCEEFRPQA